MKGGILGFPLDTRFVFVFCLPSLNIWFSPLWREEYIEILQQQHYKTHMSHTHITHRHITHIASHTSQTHKSRMRTHITHTYHRSHTDITPHTPHITHIHHIMHAHTCSYITHKHDTCAHISHTYISHNTHITHTHTSHTHAHTSTCLFYIERGREQQTNRPRPCPLTVYLPPQVHILATPLTSATIAAPVL